MKNIILVLCLFLSGCTTVVCAKKMEEIKMKFEGSTPTPYKAYVEHKGQQKGEFLIKGGVYETFLAGRTWERKKLFNTFFLPDSSNPDKNTYVRFEYMNKPVKWLSISEIRKFPKDAQGVLLLPEK